MKNTDSNKVEKDLINLDEQNDCDAVTYSPNAAIGRFSAARAMNHELEEIETKILGGEVNE